MRSVTESKSAGREAIDRLQAAMSEMPQIELPTEHVFANGMYARLMTMVPAGTTIVGRVHLKEHLFVLCYGTMRITDGDNPAIDITGPIAIVSKPGTKRAGLALTDTACMNIERTDETDIDKAEADLVEADETALFDARNKLKVLT
jgi:hypothetical protein